MDVRLSIDTSLISVTLAIGRVQNIAMEKGQAYTGVSPGAPTTGSSESDNSGR